MSRSTKKLVEAVIGKTDPNPPTVSSDNVQVISRFKANELINNLLKLKPGGEKS